MTPKPDKLHSHTVVYFPCSLKYKVGVKAIYYNIPSESLYFRRYKASHLCVSVVGVCYRRMRLEFMKFTKPRFA